MEKSSFESKKEELQKTVLEIVEEAEEHDDFEVEILDYARKFFEGYKDLKREEKTGESSDLVIPEEFLCPISELLMEDPVFLVSGQTYDRKFIEKWFHKGHNTCPRTREVLLKLTVTPNHLVRRCIAKWCLENGREPPKVSSEEVDAKTDETRLNELLEKMMYSSLSDQKEAAKKLRQLSKLNTPFRSHFAKLEASVERLLHPLKLYRINEHPDLQVDIITAILNFSIDDGNKRFVAENPLVLPVLIKSLECGTNETKANAAAALFTLSDLDSNKFIIGKAGVFKPLVALVEEGHPLAIKDATTAIFNLCLVLENKGRAVNAGVVPVLVKCIMENVMVDEFVCLLALLSSDLKAVEEMCKLYTVPCMLQTIRETDCQRIQENCVMVLLAICATDLKKLRELLEDEKVHGTIAKLEKTGSSRARKKAAGILKCLKRASSTTHTA